MENQPKLEEKLILPNEDRDKFLNLLDSSFEPNERARAAMRRFLLALQHA